MNKILGKIVLLLLGIALLATIGCSSGKESSQTPHEATTNATPAIEDTQVITFGFGGCGQVFAEENPPPADGEK